MDNKQIHTDKQNEKALTLTTAFVVPYLVMDFT